MEENRATRTTPFLPLLAVAVFLLCACGGGGGGLSPLSPGANGAVSQPTPTPTPSPGPLSLGSPTFSPSSEGNGDCTAGMNLLAVGAAASVPISQTNYHGGSYTASVSDPSILSASITGTTVTLQAIAAGTASATVSDSFGHSVSCSVGVTTSGGTVQ